MTITGGSQVRHFRTTYRILHLQARVLFAGRHSMKPLSAPSNIQSRSRAAASSSPFICLSRSPTLVFKLGPDRFAPNRFRYQLSFDISPYPPREEWTDRIDNRGLGINLNHHEFWEKREFVRGYIDKKGETWAEMLDLGWWLSPTKGSASGR